MRQPKLFRFLLRRKRKWGLGRSPNAQQKAKQHIKKEKPSGKADQKACEKFQPTAKTGEAAFWLTGAVFLFPYCSALAPETISLISLVIFSCLARLYLRLSSSVIFSALSVALSIAFLLADCSDAYASANAQ